MPVIASHSVLGKFPPGLIIFCRPNTPPTSEGTEDPPLIGMTTFFGFILKPSPLWEGLQPLSYPPNSLLAPVPWRRLPSREAATFPFVRILNIRPVTKIEPKGGTKGLQGDSFQVQRKYGPLYEAFSK